MTPYNSSGAQFVLLVMLSAVQFQQEKPLLIERVSSVLNMYIARGISSKKHDNVVSEFNELTTCFQLS